MTGPNKMKICIDREQCIGDGICVDEAPETFDLDDDRIAVLKDGPWDDQEYVVAAAEACPLNIIEVTDAATGDQVYPES